ncbi:phosphoglycolate phosphatase [Picrophilus oshimae]|nr:phosphoglycolate phosphatase [Picrophilus oshimae]
MIKLVVLDVDGTLTDKSRMISVNAVNAIRNLKTKVALVSGNVLPVLYGLKIYIGFDGYIFAENGGIALINNNIEKFFEKDGPESFLNDISGYTSARGILTNRWRETSMAFTANHDEMDIIDREAASRDLYIVDSGFTLHILNKGQDKGFAVKKMIDIMNIDYNNVLVIGDSQNDESMFSLGTLSACPGNASEKIKEMSNYVSGKCYGDELFDVFRHFDLIH